MKKRVLIALVVVLALAATASVVWAKGGGPSGPSGNSNVAHLYLHEKDGEPDWEIVDGGAWGKMRYRLSGPTFDFVFNGHALEPGSTYELIYYPDPWPGNGLICLASGTANVGGDLHLMGSPEIGSIPIETDDNHPDNVNAPDPAGAKIWLILSSDVDCSGQQMTGWHMSEYLFEYELITYTDIP